MPQITVNLSYKRRYIYNFGDVSAHFPAFLILFTSYTTKYQSINNQFGGFLLNELEMRSHFYLSLSLNLPASGCIVNINLGTDNRLSLNIRL